MRKWPVTSNPSWSQNRNTFQTFVWKVCPFFCSKIWVQPTLFVIDKQPWYEEWDHPHPISMQGKQKHKQLAFTHYFKIAFWALVARLNPWRKPNPYTLQARWNIHHFGASSHVLLADGLTQSIQLNVQEWDLWEMLIVYCGAILTHQGCPFCLNLSLTRYLFRHNCDL